MSDPVNRDPLTAAADPADRPAPADRQLGVVEAIVAVRDQCPHAQVREHAIQALDAIKTGGAEALREQAFLVFSTLAGWRGPRAMQVRRSLQQFLAEAEPAGDP